MTSTEKKCCEKCFGTGRYGENGEGICPDMVHVSASEKPVQEKLLSGHRGVSHAESIAPVGEGWEEVWDEKIKTYDKDGGFIVYVEGYENTDFDVDLMKSYISKLLQAEREKGRTEWENINKQYKSREEAFKEGAQAEREKQYKLYCEMEAVSVARAEQAERQRIEDAVMKLPNIEVETFSGNRQVKVELNAITRAAVLKVIREEDIKS